MKTTKETLRTTMSRLIIENQSEDGSIDISDQRAMLDEILELVESYAKSERVDEHQHKFTVPIKMEHDCIEHNWGGGIAYEPIKTLVTKLQCENCTEQMEVKG